MLYATRAIEVIRMIELFKEAGTPVYRELAARGLPEELEDHPDSYVASIPGCEWGLKCLDIEGIYDLGWYAHKDPDPRRFRAPLLKGMDNASTLKEQIELLLLSMREESNYHSNGIYYGKNEIRILFPNPENLNELETRVCEWGRVMDIVHLVSNSVGYDWKPRQVGFVAHGLPCEEAQDYFGNTRFSGAQLATSLTIPNALLATPAKPVEMDRAALASRLSEDSLRDDKIIQPLKAILSAYLANGRPTIGFAAAIAGISQRTLQRRLAEKGMTFSSLVDQCAFGEARRLLSDPDNRVTDVALAVGYDDPSHFARSFRRIAGVSPTQFRTNLQTAT